VLTPNPGPSAGVITDITIVGAEHAWRIWQNNADAVRKLAAELGEAALALPLDITDKAAVDGIIDNLSPSWQRIDILINNAGHDIGGRTRFDLGSADDWSAIIETNLVGLMRVTRALLPPMVQRGTGDIVNMSSISALRIVPDMAAYTTSKAACAPSPTYCVASWPRPASA
jgi:3-hydroxy acid dehydrogenase / malonic semialdehyde reductase